MLPKVLSSIFGLLRFLLSSGFLGRSSSGVSIPSSPPSTAADTSLGAVLPSVMAFAAPSLLGSMLPSLGFSPMLIIGGLLLAAPFATYGVMSIHETIAVAGAVKATKAEAINACNAQIDRIANQLNQDADKRVSDAAQASAAVGATPSAKQDIIDLCNRSASCRERKKQ